MRPSLKTEIGTIIVIPSWWTNSYNKKQKKTSLRKFKKNCVCGKSVMLVTLFFWCIDYYWQNHGITTVG